MIIAKGYLSKVVTLLSPREKKRLWIVILLSILATLIEVAGIGSVMPFVAVASNPSIIEKNHYLRNVYTLLAFKNHSSFLIFLGFLVLGTLIITNASQALLNYAKVKFSSMRRHTLSLKLLSGYLRQDFIYFLNKNSYDFVRKINSEIGVMINTTLIEFIEMLSRIIQVLLLTLFLFLINPASTLIISVVIVGIYALILSLAKKTLRRLGTERFELSLERSRVISEAFWGIKEIKIMSKESSIANEYIPPSLRLARNETLSTIISDVPKFALETAAFSAIIGYVILIILRTGSFRDIAGSLTLFVYAAYRIMPAIQSMFRAISQMRYGAPTTEKMVKEFEIVKGGAPLPKRPPERLPFHSLLELKNISFAYSKTENQVIPDLSLVIKANQLIGLAGKTGCGKTTLVDIILGLLKAQHGSILVDGIELQSSAIRKWQANLGYVPQFIYLSNDTISANVAFGVPKKEINTDALLKASKLAQLHDFVDLELRDKYETLIGERGIRLSGGQRQRIGIARALYPNPSVLILDEATSALDNQTERAVMEAIDNLHGTRTILLIAHRLTTLKKCDVIYLMERGQIIDSGSYDELRARSSYFTA